MSQHGEARTTISNGKVGGSSRRHGTGVIRHEPNRGKVGRAPTSNFGTTHGREEANAIHQDPLDSESILSLLKELRSKLSGQLGLGPTNEPDQHLDHVPKRDWYTTAEVALEADRSEWQVRKWFREGRVIGKKLGDGSWSMSYEDLVRYKYEKLRPAS